MSGTSPSVSKIAGKRGLTDAADPGQLDLFVDGSWEFTGNGKTTPKDVAQSIIEYEKKQGQGQGQDQSETDQAPASEAGSSQAKEGQAGAQAFDGVRPDALAKMLLESPENSGLNTQLAGDINRPIPQPGPSLSTSQTTFRADATSLKQIVGLLMQHEKQLRAGLTLPEKTGESNRLTGNVARNGLTLPYEPP